MFAGLDEIDWHQLEHAYGAAAAVPGWLRSLASQEDESDALTHLSLSLCHQGTVYSASAFAAPFLIELLTDTSMQDKEGLLRLLRAWHVEMLTTANTSRSTRKRANRTWLSNGSWPRKSNGPSALVS